MNNYIKDFFLFSFLCVLLFYGYKKAALYINIHNKTLVHELDYNFVDRLYTIQRQTRITKAILEQKGIEDILITNILKSLQEVEEKYAANSEGIMLLGPIGSTAIVLKEQGLENKLFTLAEELYTILCKINQDTQVYNLKTLDDIIHINQQIITRLFQS